MDKSYADKIAAEYMEKIFGFALSKTMNTDRAEELASRIIFDVYISLLKSGEINNINGYIYRVASNVYARFIDEEVRGRHISLDEVRIPCETDFTDGFEKDETYILLRKKISYLCRIQREIIVMYYFQRLKQYEIAERLDIPLGTVKWHLHDARNQIKEGMNRMNEKGTLGIKPIRLDMGMSGHCSPNGKGPWDYLDKLISQNIAYAAYHEPKTITEIAEGLGVPAAFVEDEAAHLEEYGFMDKIANGKYQTNIFITETSKETSEKKHELFKKYAKPLRDKYVPLIFDTLRDYKSKKIYTPENDFNFLMYSAVAYACRYMFYFKNDVNAHSTKYYIKRKDGGEYIATAYLHNDFKVSYESQIYSVPNNMDRWIDLYKIYAWQLDSYYDSRLHDSNDNKSEDYEYLYEYITGKITKEAIYADKFKRLFDKTYLVEKGSSEYVNIVVSGNSKDDFKAILTPPVEFKAIGDEFDAEMLKISKAQYPPHMQDLCRMWNSNCLSDQKMAAYVLELLVADGTLKPLTDVQKRSVNTIMFCDVLPE